MLSDLGNATLTLALNGRVVSALTWGSPEGPLALLLHGFPDSAHTWRYLGPELGAQGWYVVAPFHRGYAPSSLAPDGNYQLGVLARDVVELRDALDGDERTVLVGHDWGSMIAGGAAALEPRKFAAVVLLAVPPLAALIRRAWPLGALLRNLPMWLRQAPRSWYMLFAQVPWLSTAVSSALIRLLWRKWAPVYPHSKDVEHAFAALPTRTHRRAALTYYRALLNPLYRSRRHRVDQRGVFAPIAVRTLYLHGEKDTCVGASLARDVVVVLASGSVQRTVDGAGHFLHLEQPAAVNEMVSDFLAG